jgi:hypothetical protein
MEILTSNITTRYTLSNIDWTQQGDELYYGMDAVGL